MSNASDIDELIAVSQVYSTYIAIIVFGLGLLGNLFNILVFTNLKIFHLNRCAFYLIIESFIDIGQLIQLFTNQMWLSSIDGNDPAKYFTYLV